MFEEKPADTSNNNGDAAKSGEMELTRKPFRPLTRKNNIPPAVLSSYLFLVFIRLVGLGLILIWRLRHPNHDATWLWGISVVCELWFAFSWLLDELAKLRPVKRTTELNLLKEKFETPYGNKSDLPGIDIFVTTADPVKEPPLVTANTILSILAVDYPPQKLSCYISDDGASLLTFEAMGEVAKFANIWVPFCRKHDIELRNPDSYFNLKKDPFKKHGHPDFVNDRLNVKLEYGQFKIKINGLLDSIKDRSKISDEPVHVNKTSIPTLRDSGNEWPGTWIQPSYQDWPNHSKGDHDKIVEVVLQPGNAIADYRIDFTNVDIFLPMLVYVSREKRPGYEHNKKAGAMNSLLRASAVMSNGPFILNLDCDHYIYNSKALREGMCFMMDRGGDRICYVQFPQRFDGIDPCDRYNNKNTVFFDVTMRGLDGIQGPFYVGTGCLFRRIALYGFDPPRMKYYAPSFRRFKKHKKQAAEENQPLKKNDNNDEENQSLIKKNDYNGKGIAHSPFGTSKSFFQSIEVARLQGLPLKDHPSVKNGRKPGALKDIEQKLPGESKEVKEAKEVISCWYEDNTEWGNNIGWVYGSITEDVVTGYRMHNKGWKSAYCVTKPDAFRGTAPINLTDRLHQALRWATGSIEIFFSHNNAWFASPEMKILQRIAYLNLGSYPFTSIFVTLYCFLPALSFFTGKFFVQTLDANFLTYLLIITVAQCLLGLLEIKWSGITLEEYWRNEQFWLIGGTSSHVTAVRQGLLKALTGAEISFSVTSKSVYDDDDEFAELYQVKWTPLMILPIFIIAMNLLAIALGFSRAIYRTELEWGKLIGGVFLSFWVLAHLYPFAEGLKGKGSMPGIVFIWLGLIAFTVSLLWVS